MHGPMNIKFNRTCLFTCTYIF